MTKRCKRALHRLGELLVGGELRVERHVAEATGDDAPVLGLVPVVEAVATVVRHLEEALGDRLRRDHLAARRDDQPLDLAEQAARVAVGADDDGRSAELVERRDARVLANLDARLRSEAGEATHPARGLQHAVGHVAQRSREPALERRLEALDPLGREAGRDERLVLGAQLVALLLVDREPQRADPPKRVAGERLDRVDRALRPRHHRPRAVLADRLRRDVERGGHAAQREAAVAAARALGDPTRVVEPHALAGLGEPERRRAAGDAGADDDDVGLVDADAARDAAATAR